MCYAEFASKVPVTGSAYTYTYLTLGEGLAWIIGWNLLLEMISAAAVIAKYWGIYLSTVFATAGLDIPSTVQLGGLTMYSGAVFGGGGVYRAADGGHAGIGPGEQCVYAHQNCHHAVCDCGGLYLHEHRQLLTLHSAVAATGGGPWRDRRCLGQPMLAWLFGAAPSQYGWLGVISGASLVFFAFLGFDIVATSAEEVKDPQRTLPRGILGGLALVTVLYILVTLALTGMVPVYRVGQGREPLAGHRIRGGGG